MKSEPHTVTIDRLIVDQSNVRKGKTGAEDDASLAASIVAHGILQPLAVRPPSKDDGDLGGNRYRVIGGGRRLRILTGLITDGKIKPDFKIPIHVREDLGDAEAAEASLAENIVRVAMDPADEVVAFKGLVDSGLSSGEIALRFGMKDRYVAGRLALADLHPELLDAVRDGSMKLELARAYTYGTHEQQIELWRSKDWQKSEPHNVRFKFIEAKVSGQSAFAKKIGRDAYLAAGGVIEEDLFKEDVFFVSADVVEKLTAEWAEQEKAALLAEGWSWAMTKDEAGGRPHYEYSQVHGTWTTGKLTEEQETRLEAVGEALTQYDGMDEEDVENDETYQKLNAELDELQSARRQRLVYSPEQMAIAGALIDTRNFSSNKGILQDGVEAPEGSYSRQASAKKDEPAEKDPLAPSQALAERLSTVVTNSFREAILKDNKVALAFLATVIGPAVSHYKAASPSRIKNGSFESLGESQEEFAAVFERNLAMTDDEIVGVIAQHVSASVDVTDKFLTMQGWGHKPAEIAKIKAAIAKATKADPVAHFEARDFFAASSKPVIEAAMKEMGEQLAPGKKESLVNQSSAFAERYGWLPWSIRFDGYKLNKPEKTPEPPKGAKAKADKPAAKTPGSPKTTVKAIVVDDVTMAILADQCRVEGQSLFIEGSLERKDYVALNKLIEALGGKWKKKAKAHVFEDDPAAVIEEVVQTGVYTRTKQDFGQFDTPDDLAATVIAKADIGDGMSVLEPSAGVGRLAIPAIRAGGWVTAIELDEKRAKILANVVEGMDEGAADYFELSIDNFFDWDSGEVYDRVIMNPPFANQADIDHVMQAFDTHLAPKGRLVAIMGRSVMFRSNKKAVDFRKFVTDNGGVFEEIEAGAFKESGTMVATVLLTMDKFE